MMRRFGLPGLGWFCAAALLAGCANAPLPADRYHRIESQTPSSARSLPVVAVMPYEAHGVYAERPLLFTGSAEGATVEQYRYDFWAEPAQQMLEDALVAYLRGAGGEGQVHGRVARVEAERIVAPRLRQIEHVRAKGESKAHLSVSFTVMDRRREPLFRLDFDETERCADNAADYAAAVGRLADRAHALLLERLASAS